MSSEAYHKLFILQPKGFTTIVETYRVAAMDKKEAIFKGKHKYSIEFRDAFWRRYATDEEIEEDENVNE